MIIWKAFYKHLGKCQISMWNDKLLKQTVRWGRETQEMRWEKENYKKHRFLKKQKKILWEQTSQQFAILLRWKIQLLYISTNKIFLTGEKTILNSVIL